ncbi:MAG: response regulator, partial [Planctomycetes bacterium]|nr:response regulator [Planctomycetota bacterium]
KTQALAKAPKFPVLVVDDDQVARTLAKRALEKAQFSVFEAENGEAGLRILQEHGQQGIVALVDINMPIMNGIEMLNASRGLRVRSVILTGFETPQEIGRCFRTGALDFFSKPVKNWDALVNVMRKADADLQAEDKEVAHVESLKKQAEWQYWKGFFLSDARKAGETGNSVLDALHIQLNQDANYFQIVEMLDAVDTSSEDVTLSRDLFQLSLEMLRPIARMARGIGIAKEVMSSEPELSSMTLEGFFAWLHELAVDKLQPVADKRKHELSLSFDELQFLEGYVHIDAVGMAIALEELILNACKYSNPGDSINLVIQRENDQIAFLITNPARPNARTPDGTPLQGLPKHYIDLAFTFFVRFSIETQLGYSETWPMGLGLPLARQVFAQCGGRLEIGNETWHLFHSSDGAPMEVVACRGVIPIHAEALQAREETKADALGLEGVDLF